MLRRTLLALVVSLAVAAQAAEKLVGGPFVVNATGRRATVVWVTQTSEARLGEAPDKLAAASPVLKTERITFAGLKAGATYYYDVLGRDDGKGRFKTPPAGPAAFRFVAFGDTRTRHDVHARVIQAVVKTEPDFVIHTGDLVADGDVAEQWPVFFSIEKELLNKTVLFPSLGNHERNSRYFYEFFDLMVGYYSFDWGSAHFSVVNSDIGNAAPTQAGREQFWKEQTRWLEDDLARSQKADLRFVVLHNPPFTAVKRRQGPPGPLQQQWVPLFEKYKVHAVFTGHDHNYQHHLHNGVRYVVTGGGGAPLYPVDGPIPGITQKVESVENFVQVDVNGKKARLQALTPDGRLIDAIEFNP
ncbi:MAG: metallophosphoesterase [Acidobacteriota bacterium]